MADQSLWSFFADASPLVKAVMLMLFIVSMISWTFILQRWRVIKHSQQEAQQFEDTFWSGTELNKLYQKIEAREASQRGMAGIFYAGFREFVRLRRQGGITPGAIIEGVQRGMRIAQSREVDKLELHLNFLATVGSTAPYVGLFGTVWGIMTSFRALGSVQQASIAMVAPGISEALIATAMGLFAAIPAVIAYNRYANSVERLINQFDTFQDELSSILYRQVHSGVEQAS